MTTEIIERPPSPPAPHRPERPWWIVAAFSAVVLLILALIAVVVRNSDGEPSGEWRPVQPAGSAAPTATPSPGTPTATPTGTPSAAQTGQPTTPAFRFLPLWPFGSAEEAASWQAQAGAGGHQPWRLDAAATALSFATGYLGFANVDRAIGVSYSGDEAWVKVGHHSENGGDITAAEVHLARIGTGTNRPWEVVGTRDSTLSLASPRYGSTVTSPVTMGGRITGVDESLHLQVRSLTASGVVGAVYGIPAGGDNTPWSGRVSFSAPAGTVLTLVVSTGGHVDSGIERFAIMGVRAG
jgi:hypothetical protein